MACWSQKPWQPCFPGCTSTTPQLHPPCGPAMWRRHRSVEVWRQSQRDWSSTHWPMAWRSWMRSWMGRVGMGGIGAKGFLEQKSVTFKGHDRGVGIFTVLLWRIEDQSFDRFGWFMAWQVQCISECVMLARTALRWLPTRSICNENGWELGPPARQKQSCEWLFEAGNLHFQFDPTFSKLCFPLLSHQDFLEDFALGKAASCRATFENWAECLCASWLVQLRNLLYSGTQDICTTRIHTDPWGSDHVQLRGVKVAHPAESGESGNKEWVNTLRKFSSMCQAVKLQAHSSCLLSNLL